VLELGAFTWLDLHLQCGSNHRGHSRRICEPS
jgi:hypothetical protein